MNEKVLSAAKVLGEYFGLSCEATEAPMRGEAICLFTCLAEGIIRSTIKKEDIEKADKLFDQLTALEKDYTQLEELYKEEIR